MKKSDKIEFVSVVVPVYNEEGCLEELIQRTLKVCREVVIYPINIFHIRDTYKPAVSLI